MKRLTSRLLILILAISLLSSFVGCSSDNGDTKQTVPYTVTYVTDYENIKNVIFIIGDGMGEEHLNAGELAEGEKFAFRDNFGLIFSDTNSLDDDTNEPTVTTDSAAGATAFATGRLTYNDCVASGKSIFDEYETFLDIAKSVGKSTAVVTTDYLNGATPAAFTAHTTNRNMKRDIIKGQVKSGVDLLIGQYDALYDEYESEISEHYNYYKSFDRDTILASKTEDALCLFNIEKESEDSITLENATELAIDYLKDDNDGFVLVIEQAHIDKKSHSNDFEGTAKAANSLNDTIESVLEFTKDRNDTAIIVTADHETGGLMTSANPDEYENKLTSKDGNEFSYQYTSTNHTDTNVPVYYFGFGEKTELFPTFSSADKLKNCEIFLIVKDLIMHSQMVEE